eukprot:NODE_2677_length_2167_cov_6.587745.p1 GENE.NODE_2677_length_2167_cov_6.587745~~NODE_2677_length_2167_cov_6.587745.p1  ORF type:complete len:601 (+),score=184.90 NODE_2677_length_2167_cov_6.587745:44-1846(+)
MCIGVGGWGMVKGGRASKRGGGGGSITVEAAWLALGVLFVSARGKLSFYSPVLPSHALLPGRVVETLRMALGTPEPIGGRSAEEAAIALATLEARTWLRQVLLGGNAASSRQQQQRRADGCVGVKHMLHRLGDSDVYHQFWRPAAQAVVEERPVEEESSPRSPRSPRHLRSNYCSALLVSHSPVVVVARATFSGLVEILVLSGTLGPSFERRAKETAGSLKCTIFEELDLAMATSPLQLSLAPALTATAGEPVLVVRARMLVAAIELPWLGVLLSATGAPIESLPPATVTTVAEVRTTDGPVEIVAWQLLPAGCAAGAASARSAGSGFWLRAHARSEAVTPQGVNFHAVLSSAARVRDAKQNGTGGTAKGDAGRNGAGVSGKVLEKPGHLQHLAAPMLLPQPLFGAGEASDPDGGPTGIAAVLKALASVQGGQLADLAGRREVLKHLSGAVSERASTTRADLQDLLQADEELRRMAGESDRRVACVQGRQKQLTEQHAALVASLQTEVELLELDAVAVDELPQLWAQLHELQHALSLLRAASAPASNPDLAGVHRGRLEMLERLQHTWTEVAGNQLRSQVEEAEEAVAALASCGRHGQRV